MAPFSLVPGFTFIYRVFGGLETGRQKRKTKPTRNGTNGKIGNESIVCVFFCFWVGFLFGFRFVLFFVCVFSTFFTHFPSGAHFPSARPSRRGAAAPTAPTRRIISFHLPLIHFTTLIHSRPNPVKTQESPGKPDKTRLSPSRPSKIRSN